MRDRGHGTMLQIRRSAEGVAFFFFSIPATSFLNGLMQAYNGPFRPPFSLGEDEVFVQAAFQWKTSIPLRSHHSNYDTCFLVSFPHVMTCFLTWVINRQASFHHVAYARDVLYDLLLSFFPTYPAFRHDNHVKQV